MLRLIVFSTFALGSAFAVSVGELCTSNSQCSVDYAYCKIISPSCGSGTCQCIPGYSVDKEQNCKKGVNIGQPCGSGDLCRAEDSSCVNGRCECNQGFKLGQKGDCVSILKTETNGSKCFDSVQCYYNMVCLNNRCTCYTGYKEQGQYQCIERN